MGQDVNNEGEIQSQLNAANVEGNIYFAKKTRFARRFEKLNQEVKNDDRYEGTMESLKYYLTKLDGVSAEAKLYDGGFNENEVISAIRRKERFAKRLQLNRFFESAQWIDSQLFAKIKMDFEAFILPLIDNGSSKSEILKEVVIKVVQPVLDLINLEGEDDEVLNYNADDIFGMVYYLTGQCHINWKNYDSI
ncbi:ABC-three component system protein [Xanthomarina gelatinilytica]|uniref:ABC-three component system protein n=1 Tax=Xanthomarina gelatinilytica TaxID=1137281 RepID=UPI003AA95235